MAEIRDYIVYRLLNPDAARNLIDIIYPSAMQKSGFFQEEASPFLSNVLSDYWDLKYIFEYGFYWDNRITGILLAKNSATVRELANILVEPVYQNSIATPWWNHTADHKTKKSQRMLTWNNHYRLSADLWFQRLYACFGKSSHDIDKKPDHSCSFPFYSNCSEEKSCGCRRQCQIAEMAQIFIGLAERHPRAISISQLLPDIRRKYADVISTDGRLSLKENTWTKAYFRDHGILSAPEGSKIYDSFLDMIRFFACFAPLSVLGVNFLRHLSIPETGQTFALIRNLPPDFGLEQEYIYRSLYAIVNQLTIFYDEQEYLPLKLRYRDKNMNGLKEHLYLEACQISDGTCADKPTLLPLFTGAYLKAGSSLKGRVHTATGTQREKANEPSEQTISCTVDYYHNLRTAYLLNRRYDGWNEEIIREEELPETVFIDSPYYPEDNEWRADRVTYLIRKSDYAGFRLNIASFGDFVHLHPVCAPTDIASMDTVPFDHAAKRGKMNESASLLSIYHSELLSDRVRKPLPPRQTELEWLAFILDHYPNMCRMFLDDDVINKLRNKVLSDIGVNKSGKEPIPCGWFRESGYEFQSRVADLPGRGVAKYRGILDAIRKREILIYEYHDRSTHIFPYALEYDVTRHLIGRRDMPIDIMCYSLDEMRTIRILYKDIRIRNARSQKEFIFSETQKLYHILAYGLRCAFNQKESVPTRINRILDCCWQTNREKYNDNYTRCVKKRFQRYLKKDPDQLSNLYLSRYEDAGKLLDKFASSEDIAFFKEAFGYYYQQSIPAKEENRGHLSDFQWKYQTALLDIFCDGYESLNNAAKANALKDALADIDHMDIWELISGDETDTVENEIVFFNEQFQNAEISFVLKECSESNIDLVYRLFSNFICVGKMISDNRLQFRITYENFYYRRIHMLLMALGPMIEQITPAQTAEIIRKRHTNKEGFHHVRTNSDYKCR